MSRDVYRDEEAHLRQRAHELRQRLADLESLKQARADAEAELAGLDARLDAMKKRALPMLSLLDRVTIADPCSADWNDMVAVATEADGPKGPGSRVRFCGLCAKNVFNLSEMTREEATHLVSQIDGAAAPCVRFYKRADGTMLTSDCPVGVRRRRRRRIVGGAIAAMAAVSGGMYAFSSPGSTRCDTPRGSRIEVRTQEVEEGAGRGGFRLQGRMSSGPLRYVPTTSGREK